MNSSINSESWSQKKCLKKSKNNMTSCFGFSLRAKSRAARKRKFMRRRVEIPASREREWERKGEGEREDWQQGGVSESLEWEVKNSSGKCDEKVTAILSEITVHSVEHHRRVCLPWQQRGHRYRYDVYLHLWEWLAGITQLAGNKRLTESKRSWPSIRSSTHENLNNSMVIFTAICGNLHSVDDVEN